MAWIVVCAVIFDTLNAHQNVKHVVAVVRDLRMLQIRPNCLPRSTVHQIGASVCVSVLSEN